MFRPLATVDDLYNIVKKNPELLSSISPELDFSDNTPKVGTTRYRYGTVYGVDEMEESSSGFFLTMLYRSSTVAVREP